MAQKFNLIIDKGSYFEAYCEVKYANNDPVDITNIELFSGIRRDYTSEVVLEFDITKTDPEDGIFTYSLSSNSTLDISYGRYVYDIYIQDDTDEYFRIVEGFIRITDQVTDYEV